MLMNKKSVIAKKKNLQNNSPVLLKVTIIHRLAKPKSGAPPFCFVCLFFVLFLFCFCFCFVFLLAVINL